MGIELAVETRRDKIAAAIVAAVILATAAYLLLM